MGRKTLDSSRGDFAPRPFGIRVAVGGGIPAPHAPTHESGGLDPLSLGNIAGVITDVQHGIRAGGNLHPLVTPDPGGVAGFMDPADKQKIDGIAAGAARQSDFQFGRRVKVPAGGTLFLFGAGSASPGMRIARAGQITGASLQVDAVDAGRTYDLVIYVNGGQVAVLALPLSTLGVQTAALAVAVMAGDVVTAALVQTAGAGASTFAEQQAVIEVTF